MDYSEIKPSNCDEKMDAERQQSVGDSIKREKQPSQQEGENHSLIGVRNDILSNLMQYHVLKYANDPNEISSQRRPCTHGSMYEPYGNFMIPSNQRDAFMQSFCRYIYQCSPSLHSFLYIAEARQSAITPLVFDIDIKVELKDCKQISTSPHFYNDRYVEKVIEIVNEILIETLEIEMLLSHARKTDNDLAILDLLTCIVLEKKEKRFSPSCGWKDGFHLHYPYVMLDVDFIHLHLFDKIKKKFDASIESLSPCIVNLDDVSKKNWLMYGCMKSPTSQAYLATKVKCCVVTVEDNIITSSAVDDDSFSASLCPLKLIDESGNPINILKFPNDFREELKHDNLTHSENLFKKISPKLSKLIEGTDLDYEPDDEELGILDEAIRYYLPYILSVEPLGRSKIELSKAAKEARQQIIPAIFKERTIASPLSAEDVKDNLETFSNFIENGILNTKKRASDFNDWLRMGFALFSASNGNEEGLKLWHRFSQSCPEKYNSDDCTKRWYRSNTGQITMGSIIHWAKEDNPKKFEEWQKERYRSHLRQITQKEKSSVACSDYACTKLIYEIFGSTWRYVPNNGGGVWYDFVGHRWVNHGKAPEKLRLICDTIKKHLTAEMDERLKLIDEEKKAKDDEIDIKARKSKRDEIEFIYKSAMTKVESSSRLHSILTLCASFFTDHDFVTKLDTNPSLLGFNNGVLDLDRKEFRKEGRPEDFISMTTGYDYDDDLTHDSQSVIEVKRFLFQLYPDSEIRNYIVNYFARLLKGGNPFKEFMMLLGDANNGKSTVQNLLRETFGDYAKVLPASIITSRAKPESASPYLSEVEGKRLILIAEPPPNERIDSALVKMYTGNDRIMSRRLFTEPHEFVPLAKYLLAFNDAPTVNGGDQAFWNRARIVPHKSTFVDDAPESESEQIRQKRFRTNPELSGKIGQLYRIPFMWLLMDEFKRSGEKPIKPPNEVLQRTAEYRRDNDYITQYILEKTEPATDCCVNIKTLFEGATSWFRSHSLPFEFGNIGQFRDAIRRGGHFQSNDGFTSINGYKYKANMVQM